MSSVTVTPTVTQNRPSILDKSMCLAVTRKWPPFSKTVSSERVLPTTAQKKMVHAQKDLFDNWTELRKLFAADARLDQFLDQRCLPFPLKNGIYLLPIDFLDEVEKAMGDYQEERVALLAEIRTSYPGKVQASLEILGDLADSEDYLPTETFIARFQFTYNYLQFGVNEALQQVNADVAAREAAKFETQVQEAGKAIEKLLFAQTKEVVDQFIDRLTPKEDGKKKVFKNAFVDAASDFFKNLPTRNLPANTNLNELAEQAKQLLAGVSPDQLRTDDTVRANIQANFARIKEQIDCFVMDEPTRMIDLSAEE